METVPAELHETLDEFRRRYDPEGAEGYQPTRDGPNALLVHELGLDDFLASRFAIVGTPGECRQQAKALAATGVRRIVFAPGARDSDSAYDRITNALLGPSCPRHGRYPFLHTSLIKCFWHAGILCVYDHDSYGPYWGGPSYA